MNKLGTSVREIEIAIFLRAGFSAVSLACFLEPLAIANSLTSRAGQPIFRWRFFSSHGRGLTSSVGLQAMTSDCGRATVPRYVAVFGAAQLERDSVASGCGDWLEHLRLRGAEILTFDSGAFLLVANPRFRGRVIAMRSDYAERLTTIAPDVQTVSSDDMVVDRDLVSCLGGTAALSVAKRLIKTHACEGVADECVARSRGLMARAPGAFTQRMMAATQEPRVRRAIALMAANVTCRITMAAVAAACGMSMRQLHRCFLASLRDRPLKVYQTIRLERAKQLIVETDLPIARVAVDCGFSDGPHLARLFQRAFGHAPTRFRAQARCSKRAPGTARKPEVQWTVGAFHNHTYLGRSMVDEFARRVRASSDGRIALRVATLEALGITREQSLEAVATGRLDALCTFPELISKDPLFFGMLPQGALADSQQNAFAADCQRGILEAGLRHLGLAIASRTADYPFQRFLLFSKRPIGSLRNLETVRLAHWSRIGAEAFRRLGCPSRPVSYSRIREAFEAGEIEAAVGLPLFASSQGVHDFARYFTRGMAVTRSYPNVLVAKSESLKRLPESLRDILLEVGEAMHSEYDFTWASGAEDWDSLMLLQARGMQDVGSLSSHDLHAIQGSMLDVWSGYCRRHGGVTERNCNMLRRIVD